MTLIKSSDGAYTGVMYGFYRVVHAHMGIIQGLGSFFQ